MTCGCVRGTGSVPICIIAARMKRSRERRQRLETRSAATTETGKDHRIRQLEPTLGRQSRQQLTFHRGSPSLAEHRQINGLQSVAAGIVSLVRNEF